MQNIRLAFQTNVLWNRIRYPCSSVGNTQSFQHKLFFTGKWHHSCQNTTTTMWCRTWALKTNRPFQISEIKKKVMYEMDAECVCGACKPKQRGSSRLTVSPQSSKINLLDSWLFTWLYNPNSWLQWESARHTVISKLYGAQNATAQSSPLVKYCAFELYHWNCPHQKNNSIAC